MDILLHPFSHYNNDSHPPTTVSTIIAKAHRHASIQTPSPRKISAACGSGCAAFTFAPPGLLRLVYVVLGFYLALRFRGGTVPRRLDRIAARRVHAQFLRRPGVCRLLASASTAAQELPWIRGRRWAVSPFYASSLVANALGCRGLRMVSECSRAIVVVGTEFG